VHEVGCFFLFIPIKLLKNYFEDVLWDIMLGEAREEPAKGSRLSKEVPDNG
jgi:hypothetical protein